MKFFNIYNYNDNIDLIPMSCGCDCSKDKVSYSQVMAMIKSMSKELSKDIQDLDEKVVHLTDDYVISVDKSDKNVSVMQVRSKSPIGSVIWNKEKWYEAHPDEEDIKYKRVVEAEGNVAYTSKFIDKYCNDLSGSIIYLGQCWCGYDDILANAFLNKGAVAVLANTKEIQQLYGNIMQYTVITLMSKTNPITNKLYTIEEALSEAKSVFGSDDKELYPEMDGSRTKIFGNGDIDLSNISSVITIQPWYKEQSEKAGDDKIRLPFGVKNQAELITKAAEITEKNYILQSKDEIISKEMLSSLGKNQLIIFQGHGSHINSSETEIIDIPLCGCCGSIGTKK